MHALRHGGLMSPSGSALISLWLRKLIDLVESVGLLARSTARTRSATPPIRPSCRLPCFEGALLLLSLDRDREYEGRVGEWESDFGKGGRNASTAPANCLNCTASSDGKANLQSTVLRAPASVCACIWFLWRVSVLLLRVVWFARFTC